MLSKIVDIAVVLDIVRIRDNECFPYRILSFLLEKVGKNRDKMLRRCIVKILIIHTYTDKQAAL